MRWENAEKNVLIIEGVDYKVKARRQPAEIISVEVGGKDLLAKPIVPGFVDDKGVRYAPQRTGVPNWKTWRGQSYKPARSTQARVNVWNAGPYYWAAHVLDIPLVPEAKPVG